MAGSASSGDEEMISGINVTPLVDVMLCLLVIFMVTTSYVVADSLKVDLPEASTGDPTEPSQIIITLAVDKDTNARKLVLNGNEITEPNLRLAIQKVKAEGKKDLVAIIAADKIASHGEVIHLIDLVKQEGVLKFALNIESTTQ